MAKISTASNIVAFVCTFFYRITVQLAVEVTKLMILLAILIAAFSVIALGCVSLLLWTHRAYEGSLLAMSCAVVLVAVLFVLAAVVVEHLVKNVLRLTDMPLAQLLKICLMDIFGRRRQTRHR
ncbi:unnamed protein product [Candidula unifasciata]|uniref:Uncharacterized protein n=1 Tax=Candidula unifasciata TaxID=100452 RepID=A0A8S3Z2T0_9EUPU|nr:unnamed protein product [Candidula unifasciata]